MRVLWGKKGRNSINYDYILPSMVKMTNPRLLLKVMKMDELVLEQRYLRTTIGNLYERACKHKKGESSLQTLKGLSHVLKQALEK